MAARKSCTHLTWAEAKSKSGNSTSNNGYKKNKEVLRKTDHGKVLAQKVIAKSTAAAASLSSNNSSSAGGNDQYGGPLVNDRKIKKAYQKLEAKAAAISAQRYEEREQRRLESLQEVRLYDRATNRAIQMMDDRRRVYNDNDDDEDDEDNNHTNNKGDPFPLPDEVLASIIPLSSLLLSNNDDDDDDDHDDPPLTTMVQQQQQLQQKAIQCRQLQIDEVLALEAMFPESNDFIIHKACRLDELKEMVEQQVDCDDDDDDEQKESIVNHPPISFWIKLEIENPQRPDSIGGGGMFTSSMAQRTTSAANNNNNNNDDDDDDDVDEGDVCGGDDDDGDVDDLAMDLIATVVLRVTLPPLYLLDDDDDDNNDCNGNNGQGMIRTPSIPIWTFEYVMVTDRNYYCSADKALESLGYLDEVNLKHAMMKEAIDVLLPYPCVYELSVVWLTEHIFEYLQLHTQHYALRR
jgi:hypothetical protein